MVSDRSPRHRQLPRTQMSPFGEILATFRAAGGIVAAVLVDREGETVDLSHDGEPFDVLVAAAEWQLVMKQVRALGAPNWPPATELVVRAKRRSFAIFVIEEGYCLVCLLRRHGFEISQRATSTAIREIVAEAGWANRAHSDRPPQGPERWKRVEVQVANTDSRRPSAVWHEGTWQPINILGRYAAAFLARGEVGYRAQLDSGEELTLVREPLGRWYCDR